MCDDEDGEQRFRDEEGGESGRRHISEGGRVSVRFSLNDGAGKGDDGVSRGGGEGGDYSCMSSCSLPSSPPSPSSPVLPSPQAGRLLKEALHRYFSSPPDSPDRGGGELCLQVRELFHQLAPRPAANFVAREDFEALCSVLGLTPTPPASPPSGLQWLTTYCTRPGTPSPLREDRLSEAENPGSPQPSGPSASSFLWTLGPRPFWEGWAGKRGKRKELSLADFTRRLLEQWAVTHNLPLTLIHDADFVFNSPTPPKAKGQRQGLVDRLRRSKSREVRCCWPRQVVTRRRRGRRRREQKTSLFQRLSGHGSVVLKLEEQVARNKEELSALTHTVEHIRHSLHLSDAQNLGLQVLVSKVSAAQAQEAKTLPSTEDTSIFRRSMERSERQLEQLVDDLRKMSKTPAMVLPPTIMTSTSSSGSSQDGEVDTSKQATSPAAPAARHHKQEHSVGGRNGVVCSGEQLGRRNLSAEVPLVTQTTPHPQMQGTMPIAQDNATHLHDGGATHCGNHHAKLGSLWEEVGGGGLVKEYRRENTREYSKFQENLDGCRHQETYQNHPHQSALQHDELRSNQDMVRQVEVGVSDLARDSYDQLLATELEIQRLRRCLLQELKATKNLWAPAQRCSSHEICLQEPRVRVPNPLAQKQVLLSSLRSVEALGEDTEAVPLVLLPGNGLGNSSNNFNNNSNNNNNNKHNNNKVMTTKSFSTNRRSLHTEMLEQLLLAPVHEKEMENRLMPTNSSPPAHHQRTPTSPLPHQRGSTSPLPHHQRAPTSPLSVAASSGHFSATPSPGSELLARLRSETVSITNCSLLLLRSEVDLLREERQAATEAWALERKALEKQLVEARRGVRQVDRRRSVEEQLRDILTVIRSLNTLDIREEDLGRMVVEAVEQAYDPVAGEVAVFRFLVLLYDSTKLYERRAADLMLERALKASEEGHSVTVSY